MAYKTGSRGAQQQAAAAAAAAGTAADSSTPQVVEVCVHPTPTAAKSLLLFFCALSSTAFRR